MLKFTSLKADVAAAAPQSYILEVQKARQRLSKSLVEAWALFVPALAKLRKKESLHLARAAYENGGKSSYVYIYIYMYPCAAAVVFLPFLLKPKCD